LLSPLVAVQLVNNRFPFSITGGRVRLLVTASILAPHLRRARASN
jgi:hypothetical protein